MNCHDAAYSWDDSFDDPGSLLGDLRKTEATCEAFASYHDALDEAYNLAPDEYERLRTESRCLERPRCGRSSVTAVKLQSLLSLFDMSSSGRRFRNVLEVGAAPGYMTEFLLEKYPHSRVLTMTVQSEMRRHIGERSARRYERLVKERTGRVFSPEDDPRLATRGYDGNVLCRRCTDMALECLRSRNMTEDLLVVSDAGLDKYDDGGGIDGQLIGAVLLQRLPAADTIVFKVQTPFVDLGGETFARRLRTLERLATLARFKLEAVKPFGSWRCNDELYYVAHRQRRGPDAGIVDQVLHYYAMIGGEKKAFAECMRMANSYK